MSTNIPETPTWPSLYDPSVDLLRIPHNEPVQPRGHYLNDADDIFRFTLYWTLIFYLPLSVLAGAFAFLNIAFAPKPRHKCISPSPFDVDDGQQQRQQHQRDSLQQQQFESYPLAPLNTAITSSSAASPTSATFFTAPASPSGTAFAPQEEVAGFVPTSRRGTSSTVPAPASTAALGSASASAPASRRTPPKVNPHRTRAAYALIVLFTYLGSGLLGAVVGSTIVGYVLAALYKSGGFFMSTWIPPLFALTQTLIGVLGIYPSIAEII